MVNFQRRHYDMIASTLRISRPDRRYIDQYATYYKMVRRLSEMFQRDNPAFNHDKFCEVCGVVGGTVEYDNVIQEFEAAHK